MKNLIRGDLKKRRLLYMGWANLLQERMLQTHDTIMYGLDVWPCVGRDECKKSKKEVAMASCEKTINIFFSIDSKGRVKKYSWQDLKAGQSKR